MRQGSLNDILKNEAFLRKLNAIGKKTDDLLDRLSQN